MNIYDEITKKGKNYICPHCKANDWTLDKDKKMVSLWVDKKTTKINPYDWKGIDFYPIFCKKCGFVKMFMPQEKLNQKESK